ACAIIATDRFGLSPEGRGLVAVAFGVGGFATARLAGDWADRIGVLAMGGAAALVLAASSFATQVSPTLWFLVLAVGATGASATCVRILSSSFAIASTPSNSSGATSLVQSAQFAGGAVAPLL